MFDYAIAHNQMQAPSRRMLGSWFASVIAHVVVALILIRFPQLLHDGVYLWDQPAPAAPEMEKREWRNVAVVSSRMELPPAEEIRKYLYDWERASNMQGDHQPIRINLPTGVIDDVSTPLPIAKPETPPGSVVSSGTASETDTATHAPVPTAPARVEPVAAKKPAAGSAADAPPKQMPKGIPDTSPASGDPAGAAGVLKPAAASPEAKKAKDPEQQVRAEGPVFFDTRGYNLDDYAQIVRERIKQNWLIPSNLRFYQGSATIIFYIGKDGQVTDAKIELSSGNGSLDISALKAIIDSMPFPLLPQGFPADRVGARLVFAYNEK